jgi:hypothetical protein
MRMSSVKFLGNIGATKFCENATLIIDMRQICCIHSQPAKETDEMVEVSLQGSGVEHTIVVNNDFAAEITRAWVWIKAGQRGFSLFVEKEGNMYLLQED